MRALPGRFAGRLSTGALERITALSARAEVITAGEREELRMVLVALDMDGDRLGGLVVKR
jgi:hypothetical protein